MKKSILYIFLIIFFSNVLHASETDKKYNFIINKTEEISKVLNEVKLQQKLFLENEKNDSVNILKEVIIPTTLSVLAGFIFWAVFQAIPLYLRKRKLRPKIDNDLLNINSTMAHLIELAMLDTENPVSRFHSELLNNN